MTETTTDVACLLKAFLGGDPTALGPLADCLAERGDPFAPRVAGLLAGLEDRELIQTIYEARRDRVTHPEGDFDKQGRWYPSDREDCGGDGTRTRSPSKAWPYSFMLRCRTRQHVTALVAALRRGESVPPDVCEGAARLGLLHALFYAELGGYE